MDKKDIGIITALFLTAFFVWSIPFQNDKHPFGENDAAWHFAIADSMYASDKSIGFRDFPNYIDYWYYNFNKILGPGTPQYPPPNHLNMAIMQTIVGERFLPVYIYRAIASFLAAFAVYFLVRKLYGIFPAFLASIGLIFSIRESMVYLWGQTATLIPITIVPIVLYAFYKYYTSLFEKPKNEYLYMLTLLLGAQYLLHMQGLVVSIITLIFATIALSIKHKKIPVSTISIKHSAINFALILTITAPFAIIYAGSFAGQLTAQPTIDKVTRITTWGINKEMIQGAFPNGFIQFSTEYPLIINQLNEMKAIVPIGLIALGLIFLILRRQDKDILIISWFISMYFILHLDVFTGAAEGRAARMVLAETQIFYILIALGIAFVVSFIKENKNIAKIIVGGAFAILILTSTGKAMYDQFNGSYPEIYRITDDQLMAAEWIDKNLPENAIIYNAGTLTYQKQRWMLATSRRHVLPLREEGFTADFTKGLKLHNYFMADYSDISKINNPQLQQQGQIILQFERNLNMTPIYNQRNIRIYDLGETQ